MAKMKFPVLWFWVFATTFLSSSLYGEVQEIVTKDGRKFSESMISRKAPDGLVFATDEGIVKVPFELLSEAVQQKYGYNPQAAAQERIKAQQLARDAQRSLEQYQRGKAEQAEKELRRKKVEASAVGIRGNVLSVTNEGVLLTDVVMEVTVVKEVVVERSTLMGTPKYDYQKKISVVDIYAGMTMSVIY